MGLSCYERRKRVGRAGRWGGALSGWAHGARQLGTVARVKRRPSGFRGLERSGTDMEREMDRKPTLAAKRDRDRGHVRRGAATVQTRHGQRRERRHTRPLT